MSNKSLSFKRLYFYDNLGLVFVLFLVVAYAENGSFFGTVGNVFLNTQLAVSHNVLVVSLILLGMTFYVGLVLNFMPNRKEEHVTINNPRVFAFVFTLLVLFARADKTDDIKGSCFDLSDIFCCYTY
jgi:hypothetical protein